MKRVRDNVSPVALDPDGGSDVFSFGESTRQPAEVVHPCAGKTPKSRADQIKKVQDKILRDDDDDDILRHMDKAEKLLKSRPHAVNIITGGLANSSDSPRRRVRCAADVLSSTWFGGTISFLICLSAVQMGLEIEHPEPSLVHTWIERAYATVFFLEMLLKLYVEGGGYFRNGWNLLDMTLVLLSIFELIVNTGGMLMQFRLLRIFKIARLFRLFRAFQELWLIFLGIVKSARAGFWVIFLIFFLSYLVAIVCVNWLRIHDSSSAKNDGWVQEYFGSLPTAIFTLINMILLVEYSAFMRPLFDEHPLICAALLLFTFFCVFGLLNVLLGAILENTVEGMEALRKEKALDSDEMKLRAIIRFRGAIKKMFESMGRPVDAKISKQDIKKVFERMGRLSVCSENPAGRPDLDIVDGEDAKAALQELNLPVGFHGTELFNLLNTEGKQEMTMSDFTRNALRVVSASNSNFEFLCLVLSQINRVHTDIISLAQSLDQPLLSQAASVSSASYCPMQGGVSDGLMSEAPGSLGLSRNLPTVEESSCGSGGEVKRWCEDPAFEQTAPIGSLHMEFRLRGTGEWESIPSRPQHVVVCRNPQAQHHQQMEPADQPAPPDPERWGPQQATQVPTLPALDQEPSHLKRRGHRNMAGPGPRQAECPELGAPSCLPPPSPDPGPALVQDGASADGCHSSAADPLEPDHPLAPDPTSDPSCLS